MNFFNVFKLLIRNFVYTLLSTFGSDSEDQHKNTNSADCALF